MADSTASEHFILFGKPKSLSFFSQKGNSGAFESPKGGFTAPKSQLSFEVDYGNNCNH